MAILAVAVTPAAAASTCGDSAACLRAVEQAQRQVRSLSAHYVQTKTLALLEEPIRSTGVFAFQRPDRVLWRIDDPPFEVRVEGDEVRLPAGGDATMPSMPPGLEALLGGISAMFTGDMETASRRFEIEAAQHDEGVVVRMVPKRSVDRRLIGSIRLTFVSAALELRRIQLEESVGDRLEILFHDVHRNDATAETLLGSR
jgi:outer membrane lipoprotein-sorting protein